MAQADRMIVGEALEAFDPTQTPELAPIDFENSGRPKASPFEKGSFVTEVPLCAGNPLVNKISGARGGVLS